MKPHLGSQEPPNSKYLTKINKTCFFSSSVEKKLTLFFSEKRSAGVFCSNCGGNTKKRETYVDRAPPILVLAFQRFAFDKEKKRQNFSMGYGASVSVQGKHVFFHPL